MKHCIYYLAAAASLVLAACARENVPSASSTVTFTAFAEGAPAAKAVLGLNESSKPQSFWENGDEIAVFTSADGASQSSKVAYKFTTALSANATSAEFALSGEGFTTGDEYMALYPYTSNKRGVNFTTHRIAGTSLPASQTLVAGSFDRKAAVAFAHSTGGSTTLEFKNVVALLKFRVSESTITSGRIEVNAADALSGTFRATLNADTGEPVLEPYTASGVTQYPYVDFTIDGSTALATDTDYYVAVCPVALTDGLKVFLNGRLVKTIASADLPALQRNKIYNLGTLVLPPKETKTLHFDFSGTPLEGWPTKDKWKVPGEGETIAPGDTLVTYPLDGVNYVFRLADVKNGDSARVAWDSSKGGLVMFNANRYVGVPALEGYRLISLSGKMCLSTKSTRATGVATYISESGALPDAAYVSGGSPMKWPTKDTVYTFNLDGTAANTMYYWVCTTTSIGVSYLELVYEKVD